MNFKKKSKQQPVILTHFVRFTRKDDSHHWDSTRRSDPHNAGEHVPQRRASVTPSRVSQPSGEGPRGGDPPGGPRRAPTLNLRLPSSGFTQSRPAVNGHGGSPERPAADRSSSGRASFNGNGDPGPDSGVSSPRGPDDGEPGDDVVDLCPVFSAPVPRWSGSPGEGPRACRRRPSADEDRRAAAAMKTTSFKTMKENGSSLELSAGVGSGVGSGAGSGAGSSDSARMRRQSSSLSRGSETSGLESWASQESLNDSQEDLFQREVNKIRRGSEDFNMVEIKTPDETEQEVDWLKETGFLTQGERPRTSSRRDATGAGGDGGAGGGAGGDGAAPDEEPDLAESDEDESHPDELMTTLSVAQRIAVQKRMSNLTQSAPPPDRKSPRDVRDVFVGVQEERSPLAVPDLTIVSPKEMLSAFKPRASNYSVKNAEESRHAEPQKPGVERASPGRREARRAPDLGLFRTDIAYSEQGNGLHDAPPPALAPHTTLPDFCVSQDCLGATRPDALSPRDLVRVRRVALIELTALFDSLGLQLRRCRAAKAKHGDHAVFGVPLSELLEHDRRREPGIRVPRILQQLIQHLEEQGLEQDGILRVSGNAARVKAARKQLDNALTRDSFAWEELSSADVSALLKTFVRELPTPLLTVEYMVAFATVTKITSMRQRIQALNLLVLLLPAVNMDTLEALLLLLAKVVSREQQNRMGLSNVAKIMAPNLFMPKGLRGAGREWTQMQAHADTADVVAFLVHYRHVIWTIPAFLLRQVRDQNELRQRQRQKERGGNGGGLRFFRLIQGGRDGGGAPRTDPQQPPDAISVKAELALGAHDVAVPLVRGTTVRDVLASVEQHVLRERGELPVQSSFLDEYCLCETKGNIDERILDDGARMMELCAANRHAEWVVKRRPRRLSA